MAHQAGPLRFKGKLGGLSFYHNKQYGYLVRQKGGPSREQVITSEKFARTRENAAEFSFAASTGKLIRLAVKAATGLSGDPNVSQRLTGTLIRMGKSDLSATRGMRNPTRVFDEPASRALLQSFAFYGTRPLSGIYGGRITCDTAAGSIVFVYDTSETLTPTNGTLAPANEFFLVPKAATHVQIKATIAVLDFDKHSYSICRAPVYIAQLENVMPQVDFTCDLQSAGAGSRIGIVAIEFLQEKNGELYLLTDGISLGIVG